MNFTRSQTLSMRLVISVSAIALLMATASAASAQAPQDLFSRVETLTLHDGTPAAGPVSLAGDTAVVGGDGVVHVFERESDGSHWFHGTTLVANDGASGFGRGQIATDGNTTVIGADGAAYVFQRMPDSEVWQATARLSGDMNPISFGASIAISGTTVMVGAPVAIRPEPPGGAIPGPGVTYVFERDLGGANAWGESGRLMGPPHPRPGLLDAFGASLAIEQDTVIVGGFAPAGIGIGPSLPTAYVFSRNLGGPNAWGAVATISLGSGGSNEDPVPAAIVSLSGDTAIIAVRRIGPALGYVKIFQRDRGGPDMWGEVAVPVEGVSPSDLNVSASGNLAAVGVRIFVGASESGVTLFARHQGGTDAWGEVQRIRVPQPLDVEIRGDTLLLGNAALSSTQRTPIEVYVADTDRDGLRDGIDACPRDPLNNVEGGCTRTSAAYLVLDDLIALGDVATDTRGDEFHITATFTNTSDTAIGNPFFEVTELTGDNLLVNADAGPGGPGASLSPDVGDGILSAGESTTVTFVIGLATHGAFGFHVNVKGEAGR